MTDEDFTRNALEEAVANVEPADRLTAIRARTRRRTRRGRYAVGTAVLAAAAVVVAVAVVATGDDPTVDTRPGPATTSPEAPTATDVDTSGPDPTSEPTEPQGPGTTLRSMPIFYVTDTPEGPALVREFRTFPPDDAQQVISLTTTASATDPDYRTLWPVEIDRFGFDGIGGTEGAAYSVVVPADLVDRPAGMSQREAVLAVQQVVLTLQGTGDPSPVVFYVDRPRDVAPTVLGVPIPARGITGDPDVLSDVNIYEPVEGQPVSGSFVARGVADSFEATVPWQVLDADGSVVLEYSTMAEQSFGLFPWRTRIDVSDLPPGDYTFVASTDDPTGGEGPGATSDTRAITVTDD